MEEIDAARFNSRLRMGADGGKAERMTKYGLVLDSWKHICSSEAVRKNPFSDTSSRVPVVPVFT